MRVNNYGVIGCHLATHIQETFKLDVSANWFGDHEDPIQVGVLKRSAGTVIKPHRHLPRASHVVSQQEVIILRTGQLKVTLYDEQNAYVASFIMNPGDILIHMRGGHSFECLTDVSFVEAKQGPHIEETKVFINPLMHEQTK